MNITKVVLEADSTSIRGAKKDLDDLQGSGVKTENTVTSLGSAAKVAASMFAALGASLSIREVIQYADEWQNAENRLRLVTSSSGELAATQKTLLSVANETRAGFSSTAELYTVLSRSTKDLGLSQTEIVGITKTLNQSFAVSGTSAQAMDGAIRQLSQGLQSGALRGDEFNAVAESAPAILDAVAFSLGKSRGELREFAAQGGITSQILVKAIQDYADVIADDFAKAQRTFAQSMQEARNNTLEFIGSSEAVKSSMKLAGNIVIGLSNNLETLGNVATLVAIAYGSKLAGAMATATSAFIAKTAASSASLASEVARTNALVIATAAEASRTAALVAGNAAMFTNGTALAAASTAQAAHTSAVAANSAAMKAATASSAAFRASLLALAGPGAVIAVAVAAMYLLVNAAKEAEQAAAATATRFDAVRSSLNAMTQGELAQAIQAEGEHKRALEAKRNEMQAILDKQIEGSAGQQHYAEKVRQISLQVTEAESNLRLLNVALGVQREKMNEGANATENAMDHFYELIDGVGTLGESVVDAGEYIEFMGGATSKAGSNAAAAAKEVNNFVAAMDAAAIASSNTGAAYVALMNPIDMVTTRATRLTAEQKNVNLTNQEAQDIIDDMVESLYTQDDAMEELGKVMLNLRDDMSSAFADMMMNGGNAFDSIAKSFERMIYKMVADLAASEIFNLIGKLTGLSSLQLGGSANPGSILGTILRGGASQGVGSAVSGAVGTGAAAGSGIMGSIGSAVSGAGSALGGIGSAALGGLKAIGGGAMNVLGAIPGWGWALAGLAGAAALLDKGPTYSSNAGFLLKDVPGASADRKFDVAPFASGFDPVGFARREDRSKAIEVIDSFRAVDAALAEIYSAAGSPLVPAVHRNIRAFSETGEGFGVYMGLAAEDGKSKGMPLDQQLAYYAAEVVRGSQLGGYFGGEYFDKMNLNGSYTDIIASVANALLGGGVDGSHANGLDYVPFNGYRAELHEGEQVRSVARIRQEGALMTAMLETLNSMRVEMAKVSAYTYRTADILRRVTPNGDSLNVEALA